MRKTSSAIFAILVAILASSPVAAQPKPSTTAAFDRYIAEAETRILNQRVSAVTFLSVNSVRGSQRAETQARLRQGEIAIEKYAGTPKQIPGGLIHDWTGTVFIPAATVTQVRDLVRDYDHLTRYYSPDVMQSRLISRRVESPSSPVFARGDAGGDDFHIFMRLRKHKVITVVLDTEYDVHYARLDDAHQYSLSRSTRVTEIADPNTPTEHPVEQDHGFMWRLNSYWAFEQVDDGVLVECEAISLTRDVPTGLGWLIGPFVHSIPRESLQFTLNATRAALQKQSGGQHQ
jgi:hypothetical protein